MTPYPADLDLDNLQVEVKKNGALEMSARGAEVIDNQIDSIVWLANTFATYDVRIEAGHCIMTGSFNKPLPIAKGDRWETNFGPVVNIQARFV